MTYTYKIRFINHQETTLGKCDCLLDWDKIDANGFMHIKIPKGRVSINMRNVTSFEEIADEEHINTERVQ